MGRLTIHISGARWSSSISTGYKRSAAWRSTARLCGKATSVLQELQADLDLVETRNQIRERMREYADMGSEIRSPKERADDAWRLVQNVLAEEIAELNRGLVADAQILERDRLALPDGSQAIEIVYRDQIFSIARSKDRRQLALVDESVGRLPVEAMGAKLFIAGEPIGAAIVEAIGRLVRRATAGIKHAAGKSGRYMALELSTRCATKVEAALNLANDNGFRFVESYRTKTPDRRVFLFERNASS
jgi:hypothetical protein